MIFDIKMDRRFTRKELYGAGGHTTDPPSSITYSSVVYRYSVRIAFTIAALNGVEIRAADIGKCIFEREVSRKDLDSSGE